jgi:YidC/Oxa1 family membrane protein insertase
MNKNVIIALVLVFLVLFISSRLLYPPQPASPPPQEQQAIPESPKEVQTESVEEEQQPILLHPRASILEESDEIEINENIALENDTIKVIFTNEGGAIKQVYLKNIFKQNKGDPVPLILDDNGLLNITLVTENDSIDLSNHIFQYEVKNGSVEFFIESEEGERIIQKIFTLKGGYDVAMDIRTADLGTIYSYDLLMDTGVYFDRNGDKRYQNYIKAMAHINGKIEKVELKDAKEGESLYGNVDWSAIKSKYFIIAAIPEKRVGIQEIKVFADGDTIRQTLEVEVNRRSIDHHFDFYMGPVDYDNLVAYGIGLENTVDLGWTVLRPISRGILQLLMFLYSLVPNYGIAIILLAIIIKLIFFPLTRKSVHSTQRMQKMQELQPQVQEIQRKYKDNPQKSQQEIMKLYKEHGVNPLSGCAGGCLPLLLQMPILFALYPVLQSTIELRHAGFALWIKDLSAPDPYYILPIVMGISMFLQQKLLSPQPSDKMTEQQKAQMRTQRMMMYFMPIFLVFIFLSLPAGLVLYWLFYNIFSIFEQVTIRRRMQQKAESEI